MISVILKMKENVKCFAASIVVKYTILKAPLFSFFEMRFYKIHVRTKSSFGTISSD
jgi:hypothetical protein